MMTELPIDACLPAIAAAVAARGAAVIEAPPGAGKTTRVPRLLLDALPAERGEIWVLEPRRLPARLAATRVAAELGERVGETVGYAVRFDEAGGPKTRLRFITEGLFVRRMLADPQLRGVAAVVLDELHERHVATDVALAWLRRLRERDRRDLAVVAMSATLDADPIGDFLGGDIVRSEGRMFDVAIEHAAAADDRPLANQVAGAVRRVLRDEPDGDVLVFLPGAGDIRRAQAAIAELPGAGALAVLPLHGEMPLEEQARAVRPGDRRKVILSTNVAESSVTIDGVVGRDRLGPGAHRDALAVDRAADAGGREDQPGRGHAARGPRRPHAPRTRAAPLHAPRLRAAAAAGAARDRARRSRRHVAGARGARRRRPGRARVARAAAGRRVGRGARAARRGWAPSTAAAR